MSVTDTADEYLTCTCCGKGIRNTREENASFGEEPCPHDTGFGACRDCYGEEPTPEPVAGKPKKPPTDAEVKRRLGWAGRTFYEARFEVVAKGLNEVNRAKFEAMSYGKKVVVIAGLVRRGVII
jgi:hypothetical protein